MNSVKKSIVFLYTNNRVAKRKKKSKSIKYPGINLTREMKDLSVLQKP